MIADVSEIIGSLIALEDEVVNGSSKKKNGESNRADSNYVLPMFTEKLAELAHELVLTTDSEETRELYYAAQNSFNTNYGRCGQSTYRTETRKAQQLRRERKRRPNKPRRLPVTG
jgi:hypothetical protein